MEKSDDGFLNLSFHFFFFCVNICAPSIVALLVPVYFLFISEILTEGFVLTKNEFRGSCSYN